MSFRRKQTYCTTTLDGITPYYRRRSSIPGHINAAGPGFTKKRGSFSCSQCFKYLYQFKPCKLIKFQNCLGEVQLLFAQIYAVTQEWFFIKFEMTELLYRFLQVIESFLFSFQVYPGLMLTSASVHWALNTLNITVHIRDVCVFLAPMFR